MDWKIFSLTFATIFAAEFGDKTQLATLSMAAGGKSRWTVFAAAALALITASALAVMAGEAIARIVPPVWIRRGAGVMFFTMGTLLLLGRAE